MEPVLAMKGLVLMVILFSVGRATDSAGVESGSLGDRRLVDGVVDAGVEADCEGSVGADEQSERVLPGGWDVDESATVVECLLAIVENLAQLVDASNDWNLSNKRVAGEYRRVGVVRRGVHGGFSVVDSSGSGAVTSDVVEPTVVGSPGAVAGPVDSVARPGADGSGVLGVGR